MKKIINWLGKNITTLMISFLCLYALLPILSPVAFKLGSNSIGKGIQFIYRFLCHQRVERSIFLFSEDALVKFYTVDELKQLGALPATNKYAIIPLWSDTYYAYPYWGNSTVGYKVAYCIRDTALYSALGISSIAIYIFIKRRKRNTKMKGVSMIMLMLPMAADGIFQTFAEYVLVGRFDSPLLSLYIDNIAKRIVTGALFGIGFAFFVVQNLVDATGEFPD